MSSHHITSEQMEALLSDPQLREDQPHLQTCSQCSTEFESLRNALCDLRHATMASAENHRRMAILPKSSHLSLHIVWTLLTTAALICLAIPLTMRPKPTPVIVPVSETSSVTTADKQLFNNIQDDLSYSVPKPMLPLAATTVSTDVNSSIDNSKEN